MSKRESDLFHITEIYLLASAFESEMLFGLPDKKTLHLLGGEVDKVAHQALVKKEILTEEGKITKGGAYVIRALEFYYLSKKYVRINNLMFGFREADEDEVIMLVEVEDGKYYRLHVISKALVLKLLIDRFPFILREPEKEEKDFLKKELSTQHRDELGDLEIGEEFMNLEFFHTGESPQAEDNPKFYQQWFALPHDKKLIMIDPMKDIYYHASQYWFLKILFDEMDFPYKEATPNV